MSWFKPDSYLGVDIGAGGIKLVELRKEKSRPMLFTYAYTSAQLEVHQFAQNSMVSGNRGSSSSDDLAGSGLSSDTAKIAKYASLLQAVCKQAKTVSKVAVVSVPVSAIFHTIVTLPLVDKKEFDEHLKAEIRKLLPYNLEETSLDYEILPKQEGVKTQRVLVNAVPLELVSFYTKVFKKAGLKLDSLEPESAALSRSLVGRDSALTMVIDMGAERTNFFIIDETKTITHQSIEVGGGKINRFLQTMLGIKEDLVDQVKQDLFRKLLTSTEDSLLTKKSFLDTFNVVIDPIIKEVAYGFEVYLRQGGLEQKQPEKIILTGGAAFFPFLAQYLSEKFKVKCYIGDPWGRVVYQESLKPFLHNIGPRMAVSIGLALRNILR
jgi:type IV pilus assembly protein PilM